MTEDEMLTLGWRAGWRTSTRSSNGGDCAEVDFTADGAELRDTKDHGAGPVLRFTPEQWRTFLHEVLGGLPSDNGAVVVVRWRDRTAVEAAEGTLLFTPGEWTAFLAGAHDGEFDYDTQVAVALETTRDRELRRDHPQPRWPLRSIMSVRSL